jgi:hypothetical protein
LRVKEAAIIKNLITDDPNVHIGELASSDLTDVLDKIKNSVNITPSEKKRFGFI